MRPGDSGPSDPCRDRVREVGAELGLLWTDGQEPLEHTGPGGRIRVGTLPPGQRELPAWTQGAPALLLTHDPLVAPVVEVRPGLALIAPPWPIEALREGAARVRGSSDGPSWWRERTTEHAWSAVVDPSDGYFLELRDSLLWTFERAPGASWLSLEFRERVWSYSVSSSAWALTLVSDHRLPRRSRLRAAGDGVLSIEARPGDVVIVAAAEVDLPEGPVSGWRLLRHFESAMGSRRSGAVGAIVEFRG